MRFSYGNMLDALKTSHIFAITTNGVIKKDGSLIMGAGIAGEIAALYPDVPKLAGKNIIFQCRQPSVIDDHVVESHEKRYSYGFLQLPNTSIALFQTKLEVYDKSKISLIDKAVTGLIQSIEKFYKLYSTLPVVNLNFPGIGLGGLSKAEVLPCIERLPDCVSVWEKRSC